LGHAFNNSRNEKARRNLFVQLIGLGLERGRLVAFGDVGGVEGAFGVDAFGAVLFSGAAACGHHHAAITGWPVSGWGSG